MFLCCTFDHFFYFLYRFSSSLKNFLFSFFAILRNVSPFFYSIRCLFLHFYCFFFLLLFFFFTFFPFDVFFFSVAYVTAIYSFKFKVNAISPVLSSFPYSRLRSTPFYLKSTSPVITKVGVTFSYSHFLILLI